MESKKTYIIPIIFFVVLILTVVAYLFIANMNQSNLDAQRAKMAAIKNKIAMKEQGIIEKQKTSQEDAFGVSQKRIKKDHEMMEEFFKHVLSWKTYDEYVKIRNELKETYGFTEESQFLQAFMPPVHNEQLNGKNYNPIDMEGLNIEFKQMTDYPISYEADRYTYFAQVDMQSSYMDNGHKVGKGISTAAVQYVTNGDGHITDIYAYGLVK